MVFLGLVPLLFLIGREEGLHLVYLLAPLLCLSFFLTRGEALFFIFYLFIFIFFFFAIAPPSLPCEEGGAFFALGRFAPLPSLLRKKGRGFFALGRPGL